MTLELPAEITQAGIALPETHVGEGVLRRLPEILSGLDIGTRLAVVGDAQTLDAAPVRLGAPWKITRLELPGRPKADDATASLIMREAQGCDALLAVGSGTIGDLCKYASFQMQKPYAALATAASMNGYASANASMTVNGHKKTLPARMPRAILADMAVLAASPSRLTRSGFADVLARPSAQADWLLSHLLLATPYDERPFRWLRPLETRLLEQADAIGRGEASALECLMQALILSGLGMAFCGGSYPASQGEHMIAHAMEMFFSHLPETYHGEQIGVTSLAMLRMQDALLSADRPLLREGVFAPELAGLLEPQTAHEAQRDFDLKQARIRENAQRIEKALAHWPAVAAQIAAIHLAPSALARALNKAGCPALPAQLGWEENRYAQAQRFARFTRDRLTFLDLL